MDKEYIDAYVHNINKEITYDYENSFILDDILEMIHLDYSDLDIEEATNSDLFNDEAGIKHAAYELAKGYLPTVKNWVTTYSVEGKDKISDKDLLILTAWAFAIAQKKLIIKYRAQWAEEGYDRYIESHGVYRDELLDAVLEQYDIEKQNEEDIKNDMEGKIK